MGVLSFLSKKRWHPSRMDNQKRLFIKEEAQKKKIESNEIASDEIRKERDILLLEKACNIQQSDPRSHELKFMYNEPISEKSKVKASDEIYLNSHTKDDELTKQFKNKLLNKILKKTSNDHDERAGEMHLKTSSKDSEVVLLANNDSNKRAPTSATVGRTSLEEEVGKKVKLGMSGAEVAIHFPHLKNAPTEGSFTDDLQIRHKPFGDVVRYVRCLRCGQWGHASGDRECNMKDNNPNDTSRREREDPMAYRSSISANIDTSHLLTSTAAAGSQHVHTKYDKNRNTDNRSNILSNAGLSNNGASISVRTIDHQHSTNPISSDHTRKFTNIGGSETVYSLIDSDDDACRNEIELSKKELKYIATFTSHEKLLLVSKLQMREDFDPDLSRYIVDMLMSFEEYKYRDVLSGSNIFPNRINIRSSFEDSIRDYIKFITQQIQYDQQRGDELKSYKQKSNKRHRKE